MIPQLQSKTNASPRSIKPSTSSSSLSSSIPADPSITSTPKARGGGGGGAGGKGGSVTPSPSGIPRRGGGLTPTSQIPTKYRSTSPQDQIRNGNTNGVGSWTGKGTSFQSVSPKNPSASLSPLNSSSALPAYNRTPNSPNSQINSQIKYNPKSKTPNHQVPRRPPISYNTSNRSIPSPTSRNFSSPSYLQSSPNSRSNASESSGRGVPTSSTPARSISYGFQAGKDQRGGGRDGGKSNVGLGTPGVPQAGE